MECIFCQIGAKKREAIFIYEDDYVMGVLDIHPIAPGHTFLIPKKHAESILDLDEKTALYLWKGLVEVEKKIIAALHPDAFTLGINQGKSAGQAIEHLHIHVIPRWKDDGGGSLHSVVNNPPKETLEEMYEKIMGKKWGE